METGRGKRRLAGVEKGVAGLKGRNPRDEKRDRNVKISIKMNRLALNVDFCMQVLYILLVKMEKQIK